MLAELIMEEEFEIKEDEPWFDKHDLEHDLQLAAELGKSLLERNRELEQGLSQMCSTNHDQMQEIEYLTKQVELLRQVNDQHAKVYEQLDSSARDLEKNNDRLRTDNRTAQAKIQGLTEMVEMLQTQVEELQKQVEDMKINSSLKPRQTRGRQSISCLQELDLTPRLSSCPLDESDTAPSAGVCWHEEQRAALTETLQTLQRQAANERSRRERAEQDAEILANENAALEQQLAAMEGYKTRLIELEQETEELRQLWRLQSTSRSNILDGNCLDKNHSDSSRNSRVLKRSGSERTIVKPVHFLESPDDHACSCIRRHDAFKHRGISLLNEVDAQYSALQVKYEELLNRCQANVMENEAKIPSENSDFVHFDNLRDELHQPEYKELFREIFQRIQKTKDDLIENRGRGLSSDGP